MPGCVRGANATRSPPTWGTYAATGRPIKGPGGAKSAGRQALAPLPRFRYVLKTDVQAYSASIDYLLLLGISWPAPFMDDILVLAPTRWKLRAAVKVVNQVLAAVKLNKHLDKTCIRRIEKGVDWLGYHLSPAGLRVATKTLHNFATRLTRLYEQESGKPDGFSRLGQYVPR